MASVKHSCDNCDSVFTIKYDEEEVADIPHYCPFCAEMIVDIDELDEDDDELLGIFTILQRNSQKIR